jgi:Double zinc ribbon
MAVCSSCGSQISDAMNFCTVCGQPVAKAAPAPAPVSSIKTCQSCGATADPTSAFCTICGGRLPATAAATDITPLLPPEISAPIQATAAPVNTAAAAPAEPAQPAPPAPPPSSESSYPSQAAYPQSQQAGGKFGFVILILLVVIAAAGFGAWYFWGVEIVVVCSPPNVRVYLDDKEIAPTSYGRYVIPHVSRKPHLLKVQSPGFADTIQRLDFPLTSSQEWVNIRLVPSRHR